MKNLITYILLVSLVFSCSSSHHIEKRRYRKGFFVQWNNKVKETPQNELESFDNNQEVSKAILAKDEILTPITEGEIISSIKETEPNTNDKQEIEKDVEKITFTFNDEQLTNKKKVEKRNKQSTSNGFFKQLSDNWLYIFAAIITALTSWLFLFRRKKAKNISKWATKNPRKAIGAIISIKIALAFGTLHFGSWLFGEGIHFSSSTLTTFFSLSLISSALYPHRRNRKGLFKHSYIRQKLHDITIVSLGAMMFMSLGNLSRQDANFAPPVNAFITSTSFYDNATLEEVNEFQESSNEYIALKIILSLLAVFVFIGLLYLIAILTCLLACNGQEALAVGLFVFGLFGIIMLLITAFKAIWSSWSSKEEGFKPDL